eukprot:scaffold22612_cov138-Cylindrotheca_fusiformis.AAC.1
MLAILQVEIGASGRFRRLAESARKDGSLEGLLLKAVGLGLDTQSPFVGFYASCKKKRSWKTRKKMRILTTKKNAMTRGWAQRTHKQAHRQRWDVLIGQNSTRQMSERVPGRDNTELLDS